MSWHYLQGQEEVSSEAICWDGEQFAPSKSRTTLAGYCLPDSETESSRDSQYGMTLRRSTDDLGGGGLMSSVADSRAKVYRQLGLTAIRADDLDGTEAQNFGQKASELLAKCNLSLCRLKTPQTYALRGLPWSCKTLTAWGITREGVNWDVASSSRIISEIGRGLLPTPTAHNAKEGAYPAEYTRRTPTLSAQIGGKVNPEWNEWRMGWPIGWTDLKPLAMDKFQQWLDSHGKH